MFRRHATVSVTFLALALSGCSSAADPTGQPRGHATTAEPAKEVGVEVTIRARPTDPSDPPTRRPNVDTQGHASDGKPRRARLTVPALGLRALAVLPYRGSPDDGPGTRIQNGGVAASPHGPRGGVGPGGIGNYIVTAHRTSSTRAFADLPGLRPGDRVQVVAGGTRYVYQIRDTRSTSFRSAESLARQAAAVPGHPGREPTQAMITLSTCATPEDHARGNYWADEFDNPEHRIDKIGVLVSARPA